MNNDKKISKRIDWVYLIFLLLFTNQAILSLKIFGLILIYVLRPNFKFGFKEGRIPKFYIYIIGLAFINLVLFIREFTAEYVTAFFVGNLFSMVLHTGFVVPWAWIIYGILICTVVGLLAGLYPALKAGKLNPIDALRYE